MAQYPIIFKPACCKQNADHMLHQPGQEWGVQGKRNKWLPVSHTHQTLRTVGHLSTPKQLILDDYTHQHSTNTRHWLQHVCRSHQTLTTNRFIITQEKLTVLQLQLPLHWSWNSFWFKLTIMQHCQTVMLPRRVTTSPHLLSVDFMPMQGSFPTASFMCQVSKLPAGLPNQPLSLQVSVHSFLH